MLCAKFGSNWPSGSGEEVENVKSLQTDRRTDRQQAIRKAHLSFHSGELIKLGRQNREILPQSDGIFPDSSDDEILIKTTQCKKAKRTT